MKKNILIFYLLLFSCSSSFYIYGQSVFGAYAGLHSMKLTGDSPSSGFLSLEGGNKFGLTYDYRFNQVVSVNSRFDYTYTNLKYVFADTTSEEEKDSMMLKLKAVSIPLSAVIWSENGRFYVLAGIEFYFPLSFKGHKPDETIDYTPEIRDVVFNAHFGAGMIIPIGKPLLFIEVRYSQGLVDLNSSTIHDTGESKYPRTKAFAASLNFGIKIPIGKDNHFQIIKRKKND